MWSFPLYCIPHFLLNEKSVFFRGHSIDSHFSICDCSFLMIKRCLYLSASSKESNHFVFGAAAISICFWFSIFFVWVWTKKVPSFSLLSLCKKKLALLACFVCVVFSFLENLLQKRSQNLIVFYFFFCHNFNYYFFLGRFYQKFFLNLLK